MPERRPLAPEVFAHALPEELQVPKYPLFVFGLGHQSRMGKDYCASCIIEAYGIEHSVQVFKFSRILKDIAHRTDLTPQGWEHYETAVGAAERFKVLPGYKMTPVNVWTTLGPYLRQYDIDIFVRPLIRDIKTAGMNGLEIAVITDLRYPNEVLALSQFPNFVPIKVQRVGMEPLDTEADHALDDYDGWKYIISAQEGDLDFLRKQILGIVWTEVKHYEH
jgi:hypothetical protein